ncbi:MAG TPA: DUF4845 domain-containing protein [Methylophilaceae bacterium]|nr:DUF4845 domain-containing protein [Methylophilaceae bacterium]HQR59746.1 DUF4845 domain-containing protein [Methylophilaceae bacterium]
MRKQKGFTFWGLVFIVVLVVSAAIVAMKVIPRYTEYFTIKRALVQIGKGNPAEMEDRDIRAAFERALDVNDIDIVTKNDIEIIRNANGQTELVVEYPAKVPLVANVSLWLDFRASSDEKAVQSDSAANQ